LQCRRFACPALQKHAGCMAWLCDKVGACCVQCAYWFVITGYCVRRCMVHGVGLLPAVFLLVYYKRFLAVWIRCTAPDLLCRSVLAALLGCVTEWVLCAERVLAGTGRVLRATLCGAMCTCILGEYAGGYCW
jgi:hypothetical protein